MKPIAGLVALLATFAAATASAQAPDFSGTWRLELAGSEVSPEAVFFGLAGAGVPETLHVTQPENGTLVVESRLNESHARLYVPGERRSTPVFIGGAGTITTASRWEGAALVSVGERESAAEGAMEVSETFRLDGEGRLVVEIVTARGEERHASRATYEKVTETGPCESWPTPCKTTVP